MKQKTLYKWACSECGVTKKARSAREIQIEKYDHFLRSRNHAFPEEVKRIFEEKKKCWAMRV